MVNALKKINFLQKYLANYLINQSTSSKTRKYQQLEFLTNLYL